MSASATVGSGANEATPALSTSTCSLESSHRKTVLLANDTKKDSGEESILQSFIPKDSDMDIISSLRNFYFSIAELETFSHTLDILLANNESYRS